MPLCGAVAFCDAPFVEGVHVAGGAEGGVPVRCWADVPGRLRDGGGREVGARVSVAGSGVALFVFAGRFASVFIGAVPLLSIGWVLPAGEHAPCGEATVSVVVSTCFAVGSGLARVSSLVRFCRDH